jgi:hypothetical protein
LFWRRAHETRWGLGIDVFESNGYRLKDRINVAAFTDYMNSQHLAGVSCSECRSGPVGGSHLQIDPGAPPNLTAINIYALAEMNRQLRTNLIARSNAGKGDMFSKCYGSSLIGSQSAGGVSAAGIIASWAGAVARFKGERSQYPLY